MKIKVLRNLGAGLPRYAEDQVVDAETGLAKQLIAQGLAIPLEDSKPEPSAPEPSKKAATLTTKSETKGEGKK